jgi:hypothetical protein
MSQLETIDRNFPVTVEEACSWADVPVLAALRQRDRVEMMASWAAWDR